MKQLESAKKKLETRLELLSAEEKKDNTLTFEELGIDRLFVDEAHYFKNLFYISKMTRIAGLPQTSSERAFDMFLKTRYIQEINGGGGVVFATGTPIANSVAEMFTMQRYLQIGTLRKQQLHHFDSWAATFGEPVTAMELAPDGAGYRLNTRFARFINVPELMQIFCQVADIQTADKLKLPVPEMQTGKPMIVRAPSTPELKEIVKVWSSAPMPSAADEFHPSEDNMLKITSEGRKAALDLRVLNPQAQRSARKQNQSGGGQDFSNLAGHARKPMRPNGVLRFVHALKTAPPVLRLRRPERQAGEARHSRRSKSPSCRITTAMLQKLTLFKEVKSGKNRVLMGSTQKMGAGTNVQERLIALHHLDAPWRPADVEQREGRILRQGNRNKMIQIYRYVTEGSFDAYMWQTLGNQGEVHPSGDDRRHAHPAHRGH